MLQFRRGSIQKCEQQKSALAAFGRHALIARDLDGLLTEATVRAAEGLGIDHAKVLELVDDGSRLLMRAGVGWAPEVIGNTYIGADAKSPGGYALLTGEAIVSKDLSKEKRFKTPQVLIDHHIKSMINVIIPTQSGPFGLLEVDSSVRRKFTSDDINFLEGYANLIGGAITRLRQVEELRRSAQEKDLLLRELHHRVRNNIQVISSLVMAQTARSRHEIARRELEAIAHRIEALKLVHDKLHSTDDVGGLDFGIYLKDLCYNLINFHGSMADHVNLDLRLTSVSLSPEIALPLGLIANEFITNSLKYAFADGPGTLTVELERIRQDTVRLVLSDTGPGVVDQHSKEGSGLGLQIIPLLASQAEAGLEWHTDKGTSLIVTFGINDK